MICSNCGAQNAEESKFCIKCGSSLQATSNNVLNNMFSIDNSENTVNNTTPVVDETVVNNTFQPGVNQNIQVTSDVKMSIKDYFFSSIAVILKPGSSTLEEKEKYGNIKNSVILSLIVAIIATVVSLVYTMINAAKEISFSYSTFSYVTEYNWENIKELDYLKIIGQDLLVYIGIIVAISGIYYLGSLIVKKSANFSKLLAITAIGITPAVICGMLLSPLLSMVSSDISLIISVVGFIYSFVIIYESINNELSLEGNMKYYFNLICISVLIIASYYIILGSISSSISTLLGY